MCPDTQTLLILLAIATLALYPFVENSEPFANEIDFEDLFKQPWFIVILCAAVGLTVYGIIFLRK